VNYRRSCLLLLGILCLHAAVPALAQQNADRPEARTEPAPSTANAYVAASRWTMGFLTSGVDGTALHMAADLARTLNDGPNLRIIPMVGESSIQNVMDLLFLKGADLAVVQSDVLSQLRRSRRLPGIEERLQYVTKLHSEEFHVLSRMKYLCLADLTGRKVNFGLEGSGTALTADAVFGAHQVKVQPLYMDQATAIEKLKAGEIDATVLVSGKPAAAFDKIQHTDGVHFLDVEFGEPLQKDYLPAIMTKDDYPKLIAPNETVGTIAVSAVLAVASAKLGTEQYRKVSRFVESFFTNLDKMKQGPRHIKWQEVNPWLPLTGWARFSSAQQWLSEHPQPAGQATAPIPGPASSPDGPSTQALPPPVAGANPDETRALVQRFLQSQEGSSGGNREELFNEFVRWYQQKNPN
jgi:uncharacterized protein